MALQPSQVTSRANSQLLLIGEVVNSTTVPTPARMELIATMVDAWRTATQDSTGAATARQEAATIRTRHPRFN